ncbi:hypothetical protein HNY73_006583 [Argiope bruennichi]|uniref:Uncharacterized protein n=1 Tax=Argiope bruennichi TaxID=94029 RepID=A0A8T0FBA2_ARGBR|nr:hypothetical protein HNY73_006583 [Argiope bruennichi]
MDVELVQVQGQTRISGWCWSWWSRRIWWWIWSRCRCGAAARNWCLGQVWGTDFGRGAGQEPGAGGRSRSLEPAEQVDMDKELAQGQALQQLLVLELVVPAIWVVIWEEELEQVQEQGLLQELWGSSGGRWIKDDDLGQVAGAGAAAAAGAGAGGAGGYGGGYGGGAGAGAGAGAAARAFGAGGMDRKWFQFQEQALPQRLVLELVESADMVVDMEPVQEQGLVPELVEQAVMEAGAGAGAGGYGGETGLLGIWGQGGARSGKAGCRGQDQEQELVRGNPVPKGGYGRGAGAGQGAGAAAGRCRGAGGKAGGLGKGGVVQVQEGGAAAPGWAGSWGAGGNMGWNGGGGWRGVGAGAGKDPGLRRQADFGKEDPVKRSGFGHFCGAGAGEAVGAGAGGEPGGYGGRKRVGEASGALQQRAAGAGAGGERRFKRWRKRGRGLDPEPVEKGKRGAGRGRALQKGAGGGTGLGAGGFWGWIRRGAGGFCGSRSCCRSGGEKAVGWWIWRRAESRAGASWCRSRWGGKVENGQGVVPDPGVFFLAGGYGRGAGAGAGAGAAPRGWCGRGGRGRPVFRFLTVWVLGRRPGLDPEQEHSWSRSPGERGIWKKGSWCRKPVDQGDMDEELEPSRGQALLQEAVPGWWGQVDRETRAGAGQEKGPLKNGVGREERGYGGGWEKEEWSRGQGKGPLLQDRTGGARVEQGGYPEELVQVGGSAAPGGGAGVEEGGYGGLFWTRSWSRCRTRRGAGAGGKAGGFRGKERGGGAEQALQSGCAGKLGSGRNGGGKRGRGWGPGAGAKSWCRSRGEGWIGPKERVPEPGDRVG